jgi:hypothetical protein
MKLLVSFVLILSLNYTFAQNKFIAQKANPHAHSHNDYLQNEPLWGALRAGCSSIEIDVFAHENQLKVAHVNFALNIRLSFDEMYLLPLINLIKEKGYIYSNQALVLMIDFKSPSDSTLPLLLKTIEPYKEYFTYYQKDSIIPRNLQLVISGAGFHYNQVKDMDSIYVFLDGSSDQCQTDYPEALVPRGSAPYKAFFTWKGKGEMPKNEEEKLKELVEKANTCNKKLRFYAMPENEIIWKKFLDAGVYWMNIDNNRRFLVFYIEYLEEKNKETTN